MHSAHTQGKAARGRSEKEVIYEPKRKAPGETSPANVLTVYFEPPALGEINFCCLSHCSVGILLWQPW